jgi:hypothetical protein
MEVKEKYLIISSKFMLSDIFSKSGRNIFNSQEKNGIFSSSPSKSAFGN